MAPFQSKPLLCSIVTPTYNVAPYLQGAIESVASQTYKPIEHIVVDGGSTDGTVEFLQSVPSIRWISEPDNGMYDAVNKGLRIASGEVLAYLNGDDRYFLESIAIVMEAFESDPELDFVYGYCTYISEGELPICTFRTLPFIPILLTGGRITFAQPACFWRRRVHERVGFFDSKIRYAGDADFFRRLISGGLKGKLIRRSLAKFMVRESSISKTLAPNMQKEIDAIHNAYGLGFKRWRYVINETLYYLLNVDSYLRYVGYKLGVHAAARSADPH